MRASVREHLISDVPLGVWASGGLDSSAILHYAAQEVPRLKTFSVSFAGSKHDESRWFREVAAKYGTDHHEFDLNPEVEVVDAIQSMSYYSDEPSSDAGALPVWFLSRMTRQQVTVVLSGEGADELFGGYNTYLADRYAARLRLAPRGVAAGRERLGADTGRYRTRRSASTTSSSACSKARCCRPTRRISSGTAPGRTRPARALLSDAGLPPRLARAFPKPPAAGINRYILLDQYNYLPDDILYKSDRMSMAHSLELRPPFLDHRLVEFAARLPEYFKVKGSTLKFVLRDLMRDKLPCLGADPAEGRLRHSGAPLVPRRAQAAADRHRSPGPAVAATGLFRWPAVWRVMEDHFATPRQLRLPPLGPADIFPVDEEMEYPAAVDERQRTAPRYSLRYELIVVVVAALVYLGTAISPPRLMDDVDAVQAQISRNMLESGDWVIGALEWRRVPREVAARVLDDGRFVRMFGVHDWAARLPFALCTILLCWLTASIGAWAFSARAGFYAGLVMATCIGLWLFTRILIPDVILTLTIALALWAFLRALDEAEPHPRRVGRGDGGEHRRRTVVEGIDCRRVPRGRGSRLPRGDQAAIRPADLGPAARAVGNSDRPGHRRALAYPRDAAQSAVFRFHDEERAGPLSRLLLVLLLQRAPLPLPEHALSRATTTPCLAAVLGLSSALAVPLERVVLPHGAPAATAGPIAHASTRLLALCWIGFVMVFFTFSTTQEYYSMPIYPAFALLLGCAIDRSRAGPAARSRSDLGSGCAGDRLHPLPGLESAGAGRHLASPDPASGGLHAVARPHGRPDHRFLRLSAFAVDRRRHCVPDRSGGGVAPEHPRDRGHDGAVLPRRAAGVGHLRPVSRLV